MLTIVLCESQCSAKGLNSGSSACVLFQVQQAEALTALRWLPDVGLENVNIWWGERHSEILFCGARCSLSLRECFLHQIIYSGKQLHFQGFQMFSFVCLHFLLHSFWWARSRLCFLGLWPFREINLVAVLLRKWFAVSFNTSWSKKTKQQQKIELEDILNSQCRKMLCFLNVTEQRIVICWWTTSKWIRIPFEGNV